MPKRRRGEKKTTYFDYNLLFIIIFLLCFGLVMLYSSSSYTSANKYGDSAHYLKLQAQVTESRKEISRMESSYSDLKLSNDAAYSKAVSSVDLDAIRDIAINELGMVYANQDQIVTYDKQDKDYVRQYEEVPKE